MDAEELYNLKKGKRRYVVTLYWEWSLNTHIRIIKKWIENHLCKISYDFALVDVIIAPIPYFIGTVRHLTDYTMMKTASQNFNYTSHATETDETVEINGEVLIDKHIGYSVVGHSKARLELGESDADIAAKIKEIQELEKFHAILCVGDYD